MDSSSALLYDPKLNLDPQSHNTLFLPKKNIKKGYYWNEVFGLSKCAHSFPEYSQTILNTLIQS